MTSYTTVMRYEIRKENKHTSKFPTGSRVVQLGQTANSRVKTISQPRTTRPTSPSAHTFPSKSCCWLEVSERFWLPVFTPTLQERAFPWPLLSVPPPCLLTGCRCKWRWPWWRRWWGPRWAPWRTRPWRCSWRGASPPPSGSAASPRPPRSPPARTHTHRAERSRQAPRVQDSPIHSFQWSCSLMRTQKRFLTLQ